MLIKDFVAVLPSTVEAIANTRAPSGALPTPLEEPAAAPIITNTSRSSAADPADWLSTVDVSGRLNAAVRQRVGQTGSWLLSTEQFAAWDSGAKPVLWLCGPSGSGKTVLSSVLVHHLSSRSAHRRPCLFFFFDCTGERKKNGLESMLRSFVGQLLLHDPVRMTVELPSPSDWEQFLQGAEDMIAEMGPVDIVVDGIDECAEQGEVLLWLHKLMQKSSPSSEGMRLCVSSKHEEPSEPCFRDRVMHHASSRITLDAAATEEDMKAVAYWTLANDPRFGRWQHRASPVPHGSLFGSQQRDLSDKDFRKEVVDTIVKRAHGLYDPSLFASSASRSLYPVLTSINTFRFRLIPLQLNELAACDTTRAFKRTLATLPADDADMHARILSQIPTSARRHVVRLLRFALFSTDAPPLTCAQATDALAVALDMEPAFDPQDRLKDVEEVIAGLCPSLLELRGGGDGEEEERTVHLAHASVREYLLSDPPRVDGYSDAFSKGPALADMARVCMAYLAAVARLWSSAGGVEITREAVERVFPLAGYAVKYWAGLSRAEGVDELVVADVLAFVTDEKTRALVAWMTTPADSSEPSSPFPTPLSFAVHFEQPLVVSELLKTQQQSAEDCTAALVRICTSSNTNPAIAAALLDAGADPNTCSALPLTLICNRPSSSTSSPTLVHLLLSAGADPSLAGPALPQHLITTNNLAVLSTLLSHPASRAIDWTPALATVYEDGLLDAAKLFHRHGIHARAPPHRQYLLQLAARAGRAPLVALLLDCRGGALLPAGATAAALDEAFWKAVHETTGRGNDGLPSAAHVEVLSTLLSLSSSSSLHARFVELLAAQVGVMGVRCLEALLSCIPPGTVGAGWPELGVSLVRAVCEGGAAFHDVEKVRALLEHGVGATDGDSEALRAACRAGNARVVALLVERGADPRAEGPPGEEAPWEGWVSAFDIAERGGMDDILDVLLSSDRSWEAEKMRRVSFHVSHSRLKNEWRRGALGLGGVEPEA
ncbi:ankyrin repeat protein [Diplodia corticola]|uniref:Ankyrin repeat protein n=1 Tax=Diplodia corticola TaxID=236234 RepID=A0A1J9QPQ9_9PEZI|nr:ankyrin repeat protein [Diplodia corticola]OJD30026.1 ankyrin repeat protein [Diplodia corticola]